MSIQWLIPIALVDCSVGIEHTTGESMNPYLAATSTRKVPEPVKEEAPAAAAAMPAIAGSDSDSDSN